MEFLKFDDKKCDLCFKCLRVCPTKAIAFSDHKRHIIDDLCIKCGLCQASCPHGALSISFDLPTVKQAILKSNKVVVSIAPSFIGAFDLDEPGKMATGLRELGFSIIEETAFGAEMVSEYYEEVIGKGNMTNIITSCCPSANYLIERNYPNAIDAVIPVVSPMVAHGRSLKERYGEDCYVVFIGPCLAKKAEGVDFKQDIDAVITFSELDGWFYEKNIKLQDLETSKFDVPVSKRGKAYPQGGALFTKDMIGKIKSDYRYIHVDGIEECENFLSAVAHGDIKGYCAEINICEGSCINGPDMPSCSPNYFKRLQKIQHAVSKTTPDNDIKQVEAHKIDLMRSFNEKVVSMKQPTQGEVESILLEMGKYSEADQLNCNACGYSSCYDKAVAVFQGHSDIDMCLDTLRKKAESLQSIIFENSPNAICILDQEQRIIEVNPSFDRLFNEQFTKLKDWPICALIPDDLFLEMDKSEETRISRKAYFDTLDRYFYANIVKLEADNVYVGIFTDITAAEKRSQDMTRMKEETVNACQEVIENQMRVAQEIASLLGETTAETKIGLNKLKSIVLDDNGGV